MPGALAMAPQRGDPDPPVFRIHQNGRIAHAVVAVLWIVAHVHRHDHRPPALAAVGAAGDADIDVRRQIPRVPVADVIDRDQGAGIGLHQSGDAVGYRLVITR